MTSLDYRLNPLYTIKECSSCGALYTADFCCSKGGLEDKILVLKPPQNCATCRNSVDGLYCRPCAFVRKCLNEGWYTVHDEIEILNTSESSNDNTNIVSAPQEPFVFNQDPGSQQEKKETASQSFTPYWDVSMIDDEEARDNFLKDVYTFLRKFSRIPFGVTPKILSDSNDDDTSSDDNDFEDIEYVSLEEVNDVDQEEKEFDLEDILQIRDVVLREKLLNISRLITNIESLNDNPTPDHVLKSPSLVSIFVTDSNSFFEKSDTSFSFSYNPLPELKTFSDHTKETRGDSTTTHANNSLPEYDSFLLEVEPDEGGLTSVVMDEIFDNSTNDPLLELPEFESFHFDLSFPRPPPEPSDVEICLNFEPDMTMINHFNELNEDEILTQREVRLMFFRILKMTIPSHLSFKIFSRFSPT
ncbi:hypothetical protein Tco_0920597, partial [Tanacetum coccineum]